MTMNGPELTERMRQHLAIGRDEKGNPVEHFDFKALAGAGGICSTANDMLQYLKANMGVDQTPLIQAMGLAQRPLANTDSKRVSVWRGSVPKRASFGTMAARAATEVFSVSTRTGTEA
jgi:CubicO group peptidase (beta-lactamase class C family)